MKGKKYMDNHELLLIYGTDYKEMTIQLLEEAHLKERVAEKSSLIGIKPNLVSPSEASWGATTHPEVVAGIIEYLQKNGFQNLVILEGSWVGDKTQEAYEVCGYDSTQHNNYQHYKEEEKDFIIVIDRISEIEGKIKSLNDEIKYYEAILKNIKGE